MQGEVRLDLATYRGMVRAALGRKVWLVQGLGVLVMVYGALVWSVGGGPRWAVLDLVIGVVLIGYGEVVTRLGWRRLRGLVDQPWRYEVAEDGIGIHTPVTDVQFRWALITRATRAPRAWTLRTTTRQRLAIPRAAFSADDAARIDERLAAIRA